MPTYEYICKDCGHVFEVVQSMRDDALTVCPECGGELRKVFAPPAISFKGSGFYTTDHGKKRKSSTEKKSPSETTGSSETTGEAKKPKAGSGDAGASDGSSKPAKHADPSSGPSATPSKPAPSSKES